MQGLRPAGALARLRWCVAEGASDEFELGPAGTSIWHGMGAAA
jgi:hypothetical protein